MYLTCDSDELTNISLSRKNNIYIKSTFLNYDFLNKPDFLFVESAWKGRWNRWKYKIASYPDHLEWNNDKLKKLV